MAAPPGMDMGVAMAMQNYNMSTQANAMMAQCWDICYDKNVTREELVSGAVHEDKLLRQRNTCIKRCIGRNFEVTMMQILSQQERMHEMMKQSGM